jgi:ankyrin repeat protein
MSMTLIDAAKVGDKAKVQSLLDDGADVNAKDEVKQLR